MDTIVKDLIQSLQQNNLIWELETAMCEECGQSGIQVNILFVNTNSRICVATLPTYQDAVSFVSDLKRAGIIVT